MKSQKVNDEKLLELHVEEKRLQMKERQLEKEAEQRREDRKFFMDMMAMMTNHQTAVNSPYHSIVYNTYPQPFNKKLCRVNSATIVNELRYLKYFSYCNHFTVLYLHEYIRIIYVIVYVEKYVTKAFLATFGWSLFPSRVAVETG